MEKNIRIGVLLIATNKYKQFIEQLLKSINEYFFFGSRINVYLFTDDASYSFIVPTRINVKLFKIEPLKFPYVTLYRYHIFSGAKTHIISECDYVFYADVDTRFVDFVGDKILPLGLPDKNQIVAVRHCGFYAKGGGGWEARKESAAYIEPDKRINYYAGGFQGGSSEAYLSACEKMKNNIDADRKNGIMAVWHDESHWNHLLSDLKNFKELTPDYLMVEEVEKRIAWGINNFDAKILALKKDHEEIRK